MKHRKFRKLYALLTRQEKKKFRRHLLCELGYPEHIIIKTFDQIKERKNKNQIWDTIYPNKPFDDEAFRKLMWKLNRYLADFFATLHLKNSKHFRDLSMLKEIGSRGNSEAFFLAFNKASKDLENLPERDAEYYFTRSTFQAFYAQHFVKHQPSDIVLNMKQANDSLDLGWAHKKVVFELASVNLKKIKNEAYQIPKTIEFIFNMIDEDSIFSQSPTLHFYRDLFGLISEAFLPRREVARQFEEVKPLLGESEQKNVFFLIMNYYARDIKKEYDETSLQKFLSLYQFGLESKLLFIDNELPPMHLKNMVSLAISLRRFNLAETWLNTLKKKLPGEEVHDDFRIVEAEFCLHSHQGKKVIELLREHIFARKLNEWKARLMILEAHYVLETDHEWLSGMIHKFRINLNNDTTAIESHREVYLIALDLLEQLLAIHSKSQLIRFAEQVKQFWPLPNRIWLEDTINNQLNNWLQTNVG